MIEAITITAVTAAAFVATNMDNLVLLVAFYSRYKKQVKTVTAGYVCGMLLIGVLSYVIGKGGDWISTNYLGMLGIIPMSIGVIGLIQLFTPKTDNKSTAAHWRRNQKAIYFAVLMTQLSNGTDTIITLSVLLADSADKMDYFIALAFVVMILLFSALANYSLKHPGVSHFLDRFGRYLTPVILVLVGWYILTNTATDLAI